MNQDENRPIQADEPREQVAGTPIEEPGAFSENSDALQAEMPGAEALPPPVEDAAIGRTPEDETPLMTADSSAEDICAGDVPVLNTLCQTIREQSSHLQEIEGRLSAIEAACIRTAEKTGGFPPRLQVMTQRIEDLASSIHEARYRTLLNALLSLYDLTDQTLRCGDLEKMTPGDHRRNYDILKTQIRQTLAMNGLEEIPADSVFDPAIHRAVKRAPCQTPEESDRIRELLRPGFRTDKTVLRYAEVVVSYYVPPQPEKADEQEGTPPDEDTAT